MQSIIEQHEDISNTINRDFFLESIDTSILNYLFIFNLDILNTLFELLKQIERINGRLAMSGLIYLFFTKIIATHIFIINDFRSSLL